MLSAVQRASHRHLWAFRVYQRHFTRNLHDDAKDSTSTSHADEEVKQEKSKTESLLDELFRDITKRSEKKSRPGPHIPKLELPVDIAPGDGRRFEKYVKRRSAREGREPISLIEHYVQASQETKPRPSEGSYGSIRYPTRMKSPTDGRHELVQLSDGRKVAVLVFHNASPSLTEADFRRIIPRGKHIEEWIIDGEILKVIPGRDPETLTPLGFYYLVFASYASATAYHNEVSRLHWIAQKYTPRSLQSPIPIPPGYIVDGEDIHAALQSYTLLPPSQKLVLQFIIPPLSRSIQATLDQGGYARLVNRTAESTAAVSFRVDGLEVPLSTLQKIIERDGQHRTVPWRLIPQGAISPLDDDPLHLNLEKEAKTEEEAETLKDRVEAQERNEAYMRRGDTRCIMLFEDMDEAARFVRVWQKRPFPLSKTHPLYGHVTAIVDAELLE